MKIGVFVIIYKVVGNEWEKVEMSKKIKKGVLWSFLSFFIFYVFFLFIFVGFCRVL